MWKASVGHKLNDQLVNRIMAENSHDPDDWDTDPDFVNQITETEQRWGSKTIEGSGRLDSVNIEKLREEVKDGAVKAAKKKTDTEIHSSLKPSVGYGGKFGVQQDRVDKSAVGFDYQPEIQKHSSQIDYAKGFGGKYGVAQDRKDKSAVGFDHVEQLSKHSSQVDYSKGFGGKYGVAETKQDKSALSYQQQPETVGTNYQRVKPDAKADIKSLKNRFENLSPQEEARKKAEEIRQARLNKEKLERELEEKKRVQEQAEAVEKSTRMVANTSDIAKLNSVSSSPFKAQSTIDTNDTSNVTPNSKPHQSSVGKLKINSQFLQTASSTVQQVKPEYDSETPHKDTFSSASVNSNSVSNSIAGPEEALTTSNDHSPSSDKRQNFAIDQHKPAEPTNGYHVDSQQNHGHSNGVSTAATSISPPKHAPALVPPSYLNHHRDETEEEDEWADNPEPIKLEPTKSAVAPLATLEDQDDEASLTATYNHQQAANNQNGNHYDETVSPAIVSPASLQKASISAVALYDYQAADDDEISFDPNDIITDIVQIDEGWWQGYCKGKFGLFPANYVEVVKQCETS